MKKNNTSLKLAKEFNMIGCSFETQSEIKKKYSFKNGFDVSYVELDNFEKGTFLSYLIVYKMRGEYPNYERETKFKGFIFDYHKTFVKIGQDKWKESQNPYNKVEFGSPYIPASISCENNSLKVDVPDSMAYEMQQALDTVKRAVGGSINDFVIDRLGYRSNGELCKVRKSAQE